MGAFAQPMGNLGLLWAPTGAQLCVFPCWQNLDPQIWTHKKLAPMYILFDVFLFSCFWKIQHLGTGEGNHVGILTPHSSNSEAMEVLQYPWWRHNRCRCRCRKGSAPFFDDEIHVVKLTGGGATTFKDGIHFLVVILLRYILGSQPRFEYIYIYLINIFSYTYFINILHIHAYTYFINVFYIHIL